jgi:hypothetical protein
MAKEKDVRTVNISSIPELLRLVEEVMRDNHVIVLAAEDRDMAVLSPLTSRRGRSRGKRLSEADVAAFRSSAGSWSDVDTDKLLEDIYESRARSSRPPVEL